VPGRVAGRPPEVGRIGDGRAGEAAEELVGSVIELYGQGLARIVATVAESTDPELAQRLAEDGVIASLMLIHVTGR